MISVVISTYGAPRALDAVMRGLAEQYDDGFEVIVAEDARQDKTAAVVESWRGTFGDQLRHVTQEDKGFRLSRARNLGALASRGDHLAFLHGDCVPRRGLVRTVRRTARTGWFAATYRFDLSRAFTDEVLANRLPVHRYGLVAYARRRHDFAGYAQWLGPGDRRRIGARRRPDFVPPYENYGFLAVTRLDFEAVNGFDMGYEGWGGEDVDLARRLRHSGLRCGWPGPAATIFHLWHPSRKDVDKRYLDRLREAERSNRVRAVVGLEALAQTQAGKLAELGSSFDSSRR